MHDPARKFMLEIKNSNVKILKKLFCLFIPHWIYKADENPSSYISFSLNFPLFSQIYFKSIGKENLQWYFSTISSRTP